MSSSHQRIALAAAALVLPLLLAEGASRVARKVTDDIWTTAAVHRHQRQTEVLRLYRRHPFTNTALRPGATATLDGRTARIDPTGYRGPDRPIPRAAGDGTLRIVCSGGSTTFDLLAASNEATWPALLEAELRRRGIDAEVWNAGFPGWTTLENLIALAMRDLELAPDVVLLYQGINDLQPAGATPVDPTYERGHAELAVAALGFDLEPPGLLQRSVLLELLRGAVGGGSAAAARIAAPELEQIFPQRRRRLPPEARAVFERNVASFLAVARAHGATPVLISQPMRLREGRRRADERYVESWTPGFDAEAALASLAELNDAGRSVASAVDVPWIDAARGVGWSDADFADPMHYTPSGSRKLARFLAERLVVELGLAATGEAHGS